MGGDDLPLDDDIGDEDEIVANNSDQEASDRFKTIEDRCRAAGIEFKERIIPEAGKYIVISLPSGREKREIVITKYSSEQFISASFEKYIAIKGYEAIASYSAGTIEVGLRTTSLAPQSAIRRILGNPESHPDLREIIIEPSADREDSPVIRIGPASTDYNSILRPSSNVRKTTLTLSGLDIKRHDDALAIMKRYSDSLFFQIDQLIGMTFNLERERGRRSIRPGERRPMGAESIQYPTSEYNDAAISLYWYARTASGMPLLQFLALYQSIEFYFPVYSQVEARRRVGHILKDPTFRGDRDADIGRLISAIQSNRSGSIGDERSQLRATIHECVSSDDMRHFLNRDPDREAFYLGKSRKSVYHKIPLANVNADLRGDVADRIYDIRCKIVHTKNEFGDGNSEMLLPFTEDADYLIYDIELVQFIAKSVLVAGSLPLG